MPGAARKDIDEAGGQLVKGSPNVFVNDRAEVRVGDEVKGHGDGKHANPTMAEGSSSVFVNNIAASRKGDKATCGHLATGSSNVFING